MDGVIWGDVNYIEQRVYKMDKYQIALLANVRKQLQEWTDQNEEIPHEEVYRFAFNFWNVCNHWTELFRRSFPRVNGSC